MGFSSSVISHILRLDCSTIPRKWLNVSILRITEAIYATGRSLLQALCPWLPLSTSFPWFASSTCSLPGKECVELWVCFGRRRMERTRTRCGRQTGSYITSAPNLHDEDCSHFISKQKSHGLYYKESLYKKKVISNHKVETHTISGAKASSSLSDADSHGRCMHSTWDSYISHYKLIHESLIH